MKGAKRQPGGLARQFLRDYLLISVLPMLVLLVVSVGGGWFLLRYTGVLVETQAADLSAGAEAQLRQLGQQMIRNKAQDVAAQIDLYLAAHPDATIAQLQADAAFREIARQPVGETGYTAVHEAETDIVRFHTNPDLVNTSLSNLAAELPEFWVIFHSPAGEERSGYYNWLEPTGALREKYMVVVPVPQQIEGLTLMVAATTYIDEFSRPMQVIRARAAAAVQAYAGVVRQVVLWGGGALLVVLGLALGGVHRLGARAVRTYISPIRTLAEMATDLGEGSRVAQAPAELLARPDEVGVLARELRHSAARVHELVDALEQRVAERTTMLEQQALQLRTAADVGRVASSTLDPERLIWQVTNLIQERFDFYHVALLLVDATGEWVEYRAGSGEAGQLIGEQGLRFEVGGRSMIGWCAAHARPRVAQDVREEEQFAEDPNLLLTRSEAVLPLVVRGSVVGVLDVQSVAPAAFGAEVVGVLETMADQVAVALDNARLYAESQQALETERRAYSDVSREAWLRTLRTSGASGYLRDLRGNIQAVSGDPAPEMTQARDTRQIVRVDAYTLAVPVLSRDQVLGVARLRKLEDEGAWTESELAIVQTLVEQLGVALESARLYQDTQKSAARERMTGEISARIRQSLDMDTMLQMAIREIGESLGLARVKVRMVATADAEHVADGSPSA